jgi:hypothetical protein
LKAARSFISLFAGWATAFVTQILWQVYRPGFGYVTDFGFFLFWPALFALVGWAVFGLPLVYFTPERIASRWHLCIVVGIVVCVLAYLLLVCTWLPQSFRLAWFPAIIGAVGGFTYWLLGRAPAASFLARWRRVAVPAMFLAPGIAVAAFAFLIWPVVLRVSPYLGYRFGAYESRALAEYEIYSRIRPGDTFSDLHRRYPAIFDEPMLSRSSNQTIKDFEWSYHIVFDETRTYVTKIDVKRPN